jgi:hypothetical protein
MRVIALIQEPQVIDKILAHLRARGRDARAGPWATGRRRAGRARRTARSGRERAEGAVARGKGGSGSA